MLTTSNYSELLQLHTCPVHVAVFAACAPCSVVMRERFIMRMPASLYQRHRGLAHYHNQTLNSDKSNNSTFSLIKTYLFIIYLLVKVVVEYVKTGLAYFQRRRFSLFGFFFVIFSLTSSCIRLFPFAFSSFALIFPFFRLQTYFGHSPPPNAG